MHEEVDFLFPVLQAAGEQFHVVGHSYGAAVAMQLAARYPERMLSIVMYEPTLFYLVAGVDPSTSPAAGIWQASSDAAALVRGGNNAAAAAFASLQMPVLLMLGDCSPESSQSVVRLPGAILPDVTSGPQPGLAVR